jgi:general secretion pathway protein G
MPTRKPHAGLLAGQSGRVHPSLAVRVHARRQERGLTLVELMIVIALIGLLTAALAVGVFRAFEDGRGKTATIACNQLRTAAQTHFVNAPEESECPTPARMLETHELDAAVSLRDPWGTPYRVECSSNEIVAISAGRDRAFGTEDDIRVPGPRGAAGIASIQP